MRSSKQGEDHEDRRCRQRRLPGIAIVKAFNMMFGEEMEARADGETDKSLAVGGVQGQALACGRSDTRYR